MSLLSLVKGRLKDKDLTISKVVDEMDIARNTFYYQLKKPNPDKKFKKLFKDVTEIDINSIILEIEQLKLVNNKIESLERLARLKDGNYINENEYTVLKNEIIYQ